MSARRRPANFSVRALCNTVTLSAQAARTLSAQAARTLSARAALALLLLSARGVRAEPGDDQYRFAEGTHEVRAVALESAANTLSLRWPELEASTCDAALLGVRVRAVGREPYVDLTVAGQSSRQHFEHGAQGLRWLNLTSLREALTRASVLEVRLHDVAIEPQLATLRVYPQKLARERTILVVAPHPDDAEIAAFGLYTTYAQKTSVVTITSGSSGDMNYEHAFGADLPAHYRFKGTLRAIDSVTVPLQGGVPPARCLNLGYFDSRLAEMHASPARVFGERHGSNDDVSVYRQTNVNRLLPKTPRSSTWQHLVEDLTTVLRKVQPTVVVIPHPWLDTHVDHQFAAVAVVEAARRWQRPLTFLLYTNHASGDLYPFGPAGTSMSLPPWSGPVLPVQRVYSLPVARDLQRRKLFALESMHDLRLSPAEQETCGVLSNNPPDYARSSGAGYYRRGPRAEETFFAFDRAGVEALIESFLAARAPAPTAR